MRYGMRDGAATDRGGRLGPGSVDDAPAAVDGGSDTAGGRGHWRRPCGVVEWAPVMTTVQFTTGRRDRHGPRLADVAHERQHDSNAHRRPHGRRPRRRTAEDGADRRRRDGGLNRRDREILAFERQWWKYAGAKEQAIRELFDMSATRYYQVLNSLIDTPEALAADPMLVKRLRRLRASRQRQRSARRLGIEV